MKNILLVITVSLCVMSHHVFTNASEGRGSYAALFEEICQIMEENFYDSSLIQEKMPSLKEEYSKEMKDVSKQAVFSAKMNAILGRFDASHTYYLSPSDYEYYHLAAVFSFLPAIKTLFRNQTIEYPTVGIITETIENRLFIVSVLSGSIAEQAGLLTGDEIVEVNGTLYQPIDSLREYVGKQVMFSIRRNAGGNIHQLNMTPKRINPKTEMLEAEKASIRVIETQRNKIGYIHIYSYAGEEYHDELISAISQGALKDADALIIDLRYGLGGADPSYLNIFNIKIPAITSIDNSGTTYIYDPQWRKPTVFLVNKTTRSGKEILTFGARKYKLATVIGERTAGAALSGALFPLSNGDLLYLAVRSTLIDGVSLEGVGVAPDIEIPMDIRYCKGKDDQLQSAVDYFRKTLQPGTKRRERASLFF